MPVRFIRGLAYIARQQSGEERIPDIGVISPSVPQAIKLWPVQPVGPERQQYTCPS
jgi:hypothetical protein